jgi:hypothetical protein
MTTNNSLNNQSPLFTVDTITINDAPVSGTDGTNKAYVDLIAGGFTFKNTTYASTTSNLNVVYNNGAAGVGATLTNNGALAAFSTDGTSPAVNSRILVQFQTTTFQNGIYSLTTVGSGAVAWVLTRTTDYDTAAEIQPGDIVPVANGTLYNDTLWIQTDVVTTIGTDPILFNQFGGQAVTTVQYSSLVGGASNTITSVAPSATAGVPLVSTGNASDPSFSTAVVAGGGTGATSFTAYTPICGGTSGGAALQSVASVGTAGQVLTSNGAGMLATFQNVSGEPGSIVQVQSTYINTILSGVNQVIPLDNTIPQNTEGMQIITVSITPQNAANNLYIAFNTFCGTAQTQSAACIISAALFRDATANAISASLSEGSNPQLAQSGMTNFGFTALVNAGSTAATTFAIRMGLGGNSWMYINGYGDQAGAGTQLFGGVASTSLVVMEIQA